jgi:hypothetical protein
VLAGIAVTNGDLLRLNLQIPNTGPGGGDNPGSVGNPAGFPNGRRLRDDTIDTLLTIITNQPQGATFGDNVNANEKPLQDFFPFLALPNQPFPPGTLDDLTRN